MAVSADLDLPSISTKPGIAVGDPLDSQTSRSVSKTAQPDDPAIIGEGVVVPSEDIGLFRYGGDRVVAGCADQGFLPFGIIALTVEHKTVFQIREVIDSTP